MPSCASVFITMGSHHNKRPSCGVVDRPWSAAGIWRPATYTTDTKWYCPKVNIFLEFPACKFSADCALSLHIPPGIHTICHWICHLHFSAWLSLCATIVRPAWLDTVREINIIIIVRVLVVAVRHCQCTLLSNESGDSLIDYLWKAFVRFRSAGVKRQDSLQPSGSNSLNIHRVPRTLLRTSATLKNGVYVHMEIENAPKIQLLSMDSLPSDLELQLIFDEATVFRSSNMRFWSLLPRVIKPLRFFMVAVAFWCGAVKPSDVSDFLKQITRELATLLNEYIKVVNIFFYSSLGIRCLWLPTSCICLAL